MEQHNSTLYYLLMEFFAVGILSSLYLLAFDSVLRAMALLHWVILLLFIILALVLYALARIRKIGKAYLGLSIISTLMVLAMLGDAALGLPLSKAHVPGVPNLGWNYLFGFGAPGTGSAFNVSFAFTLMFSSLIVLAALSYVAYKRNS